MARSPVSYYSDEIFEVGLGHVVVCRFKGGGRIETGVFLVDVYCLGVKDAFFSVFRDEAELREEFLDEHLPGAEARPGAAGRKLVEGAVKYAASLGFAPHADYKQGARVFGGIRAEDCPEAFVFGRDGQPVFISGPFDSREREERILAVLQARTGGNFVHEIAEFEDEFENEFAEDERVIPVLVAIESGSEGNAPSAELEEFVDDFGDRVTFHEVVFNPEGTGAVATDLLFVARQLLAQGESETLDDAVLEMQAIFNFFALPPEAREALLAEAPNLRQDLASHSEFNPLPYMIEACRLEPGPSEGAERLLLLCSPV